MIETPVRIGVVGIGFGQSAHVPAFRADPRCSVDVIAASDVDRAAAVAARLAIPRSTGDWREVAADPRIDVVSVAVPPLLQPEIVIAAARAGKHVLCEKPAAVSVAAARDMLVAAEGAGIVHAIDFELPELPTWRRAHELVRSGAVGEVRHLYVDWRVAVRARRAGSPSWKTSQREGGGALGGFASHVLYNVEWLCGPIARLRARTRGSPDDIVAVDVWLELASGALASATIATDAVAGSGHLVEVVGSSGGLRLSNESTDHGGPFTLTLSSPAGVVERRADPAVAGDRRAAALASLVHRFVDGVCSGTVVKPNLADGTRVQALIGAVVDSDRSDAWTAV